jgi:Domain of unknown function (DUF4440)
MSRFVLFVILLSSLTIHLRAQNAPDAAELTKLLNDFLAGATRNDAATHDRFWAEDLIYTRSAGKRIGKADIMRDLKPTPGEPATTYTAEDIRIQEYGTTAIVAFRLVGTSQKDGATQVANFLNTGTFLKRNGKWQAVAWQATKIPRSEEEMKKEVAATEGALHQAMLAADIKKLESLLDETFVWTHGASEQMTRQQLLDELRSGQLKYSKLETKNVTVYSDAAVVRGDSFGQRSTLRGAEKSSDAASFAASYTLTLVNKDGDWKPVAMHSTQP